VVSDILGSVKKGIIHVGGHTGQERFLYDTYDCNVLWIEADPGAFKILQENIHLFPKQVCIEVLVSDSDEDEFGFYLSGSSKGISSIYDFKKSDGRKHKEKIFLPSRRMDTVLKERRVELCEYDCLVSDVQAADFLVLKGMGEYLDHINFLIIELYVKAPYDTPYVGDCVEKEAHAFILEKGFSLVERELKTNTFGSEWVNSSYVRRGIWK